MRYITRTIPGFHPALMLAAGALAVGASPLLAQDAPPQPPAQPTSSEQQRRELNLEQARLIQAKLKQFAEAKAQYETQLKQVADAKAKIAADHAAAEAAYQAQLDANKAEADRITSEHDAAVAKWKADVAACEKGDKSRCANSS